jgi:hypothetical protein
MIARLPPMQPEVSKSEAGFSLKVCLVRACRTTSGPRGIVGAWLPILRADNRARVQPDGLLVRAMQFEIPLLIRGVSERFLRFIGQRRGQVPMLNRDNMQFCRDNSCELLSDHEQAETMPYLSPSRPRPRSVPLSSTSDPFGLSERQVFTIQLRAEPGIDGIRSLRRALKLLRRYYALKCTSACEGTIADAFLFNRQPAKNNYERGRPGRAGPPRYSAAENRRNAAAQR